MTPLLIILLMLITASIEITSAQINDYYCGSSFSDAKSTCPFPCPSGLDSECTKTLGDDYRCYFFTGCSKKVGAVTNVMTERPTSSPETGAPSTKPSSLHPSNSPTAAIIKTESPTLQRSTPNPTLQPVSNSAAPISPQQTSLIPTESPTLEATTTIPTFTPTKTSTLPEFISLSLNDPISTPTYQPNINAPTLADDYETNIHVVMTLQNTANRSLTAGESDKLKYLLLNFFFLHEFDGVKVYDVVVYHQEVVAWDHPIDDDEELDIDDTTQRRLDAAPTAITTTAITIILQVTHGGCYTDNELGDALMTVMEDNSSDIVKELRMSQGYPFFSKVDAVRFGIVDEEYVDGLVPNVARGSSGENDVHGSGRKTGIIIGVTAGVVLMMSLSSIALRNYLKFKHYQKKYSERMVVLEKDVETGLAETSAPSGWANTWTGRKTLEIDDSDSSDVDSSSGSSNSSYDGSSDESNSFSGRASVASAVGMADNSDIKPATKRETLDSSNRSASKVDNLDTSTKSARSDNDEASDAKLHAKIEKRREERRKKRLSQSADVGKQEVDPVLDADDKSKNDERTRQILMLLESNVSQLSLVDNKESSAIDVPAEGDKPRRRSQRKSESLKKNSHSGKKGGRISKGARKISKGSKAVSFSETDRDIHNPNKAKHQKTMRSHSESDRETFDAFIPETAVKSRKDDTDRRRSSTAKKKLDGEINSNDEVNHTKQRKSRSKNRRSSSNRRASGQSAGSGSAEHTGRRYNDEQVKKSRRSSSRRSSNNESESEALDPSIRNVERKKSIGLDSSTRSNSEAIDSSIRNAHKKKRKDGIDDSTRSNSETLDSSIRKAHKKTSNKIGLDSSTRSNPDALDLSIKKAHKKKSKDAPDSYAVKAQRK